MVESSGCINRAYQSDRALRPSAAQPAQVIDGHQFRRPSCIDSRSPAPMRGRCLPTTSPYSAMNNNQLAFDSTLPPCDALAWSRAQRFSDPRAFYNDHGDHIEDVLTDANLPWMYVHVSNDIAVADATGAGCSPAKAFVHPDGSMVVVDVSARWWEIADADGLGPSGAWSGAGLEWEE